MLEIIIIICTISVITSKNPVHSILFLILVFLNTSILLISHGIDFLGIFIIIVYVGAIAILFLFVLMMLNVRRCVGAGRVFIHRFCSDKTIATELGETERVSLNIASQIKGNILYNQAKLFDSQANFSMVRTKMFEDCPLVISHHGSYPACYWISRVLDSLYLRVSSRTTLGQSSIRALNVGHNLPKEIILEPATETTGSPKRGNSHGDGAIIVPVEPQNSYATVTPFGRGRIAELLPNYFNCMGGGASRRFSSKTAISGKTIQEKLLDLAQWCKNHPEKEVDRTLYKLLLDSQLFMIAYDKLKSNPGNLTPGLTPTTFDGISQEWIEETIVSLRNETFQFTPGRLTLIPKGDGSQRPLTIAPPRDKIIQEMIIILLEAIFEPTFSDHSHGFRQNRSCHTALKEIHQNFRGATWMIEGDIEKCFDSIDQQILMKIIESRILDRRFTNLIWKALGAGYFIFREYHHSIIGTPQGSGISPILANIYLDKLDKYIEELMKEFNKGERCRPNPKYTKLRYQRDQESESIFKEMHKTPYGDPFDPNSKRLIYVRYADDWVIGIRGSFEESRNILDKVSEFLKNVLALKVSTTKSQITHLPSSKALFLGVYIGRSHHRYFRAIANGKQRMPLMVRFEVPIQRIISKLTKAGFISNGKPAPRFLWLHNDKDTIITLYNSVFRGYLNYYSFVQNYSKLVSILTYILKSSCAKLLAAKFSMERQSKVFRKFGKNLKGTDKISFIEPSYRSNPLSFKSKQSEYIKTLFATTISKATLDNLRKLRSKRKNRNASHKTHERSES